MAKAKKVKQLAFTLPDRAGLLAEVTTVLAGAKVNINALCAYGMEGTAWFTVIPDSMAKAKKALLPWGVELREEEVVGVELPNKPGELQKVAKKIAEAGINVEYAYGTTGTGKAGIVVFKTADNAGAVKVINK